MRLGAHVSIAGKIYESLDRAKALGCNTMQIFSRNPRGWKALDLNPLDVEEFRSKRKALDIDPVVVHIPYLINLASPEKALYEKSIKSYIDDVKRADALGADFFVTHLGSHRGSGEDKGISRFADAINVILKETKPKLEILLETTAGSGYSLGSKFEHIKKILAKVKNKKKVGVCLDTAHIFAAGYDISKKGGAAKVLDEFDKILGISKLKVIHLNDSKAALGSKVDRHNHIGKGEIGSRGMGEFLRNKRIKDIPLILETPKDSPEDDINNLKKVRRLSK